jgi:hypothetical protein
MSRHIVSITVAALLLCSCSIQRANTASEAQTRMVGISKEQVLACMGAPQGRSAEGATEVWAYNSGGSTVGFGTSNTNSSGFASATGSASGVANNGVFSGVGNASGAYSGQTQTTTFLRTQARYCVVNVVMKDGVVAAVNYTGPTGGILSKGEQCAYAVQNCVK